MGRVGRRLDGISRAGGGYFKLDSGTMVRMEGKWEAGLGPMLYQIQASVQEQPAWT